MASKQASRQRAGLRPSASGQVAISSSPTYLWISPLCATIAPLRSPIRRLSRPWKATSPSRSAAAVSLHVDDQEDALLHPRPVVAAGDEGQQDILAQQGVHLEQ